MYFIGRASDFYTKEGHTNTRLNDQSSHVAFRLGRWFGQSNQSLIDLPPTLFSYRWSTPHSVRLAGLLLA